MKIIDICAIVFIILSALAGFKRGAIKGLVQFIGLVAVTIVAYQFKGIIGNFLIDKLPFFNFGGAVKDIYAINLLFYQSISFVIIFVLLYCVLNIMMFISGFLDTLVKLTLVFEIPNKIIGILIGAIEGVFFVFVVGFAMSSFGHTQKYVMESDIVYPIVTKTPIVNQVFAQSIRASKAIYEDVKNAKTTGTEAASINIARDMLSYGLVDADTVTELIANGKLHVSESTQIKSTKAGE